MGQGLKNKGAAFELDRVEKGSRKRKLGVHESLMQDITILNTNSTFGDIIA